MAEPEPNKKWDELLRAQARTPRPEIELHPAARRLLHEDVKKTYGGAPARPSRFRAFSRWWIRWPLATAFVACAILLVVQNRRFEETKQPEDKKKESATSDVLSTADQPKGQVFGGRMLAAPAAPAPANEKDAASGIVTRRQRGGYALRDAASPRFLNAQPEQSAALQAFEVERSGTNVLVVDQDGSVYLGAVTGSKAQTNAGFAFKVSGANLTLQAALDFRGQLDPAVTNGPTQAPSRVTGMAAVAGTNQVRVDAVQK